jgi:ectoine hydroxylase-related dioxygenase (phytanoyl-CoA dioxygenase family)
MSLDNYQEQLRNYEEHGYAVFRNVLPPETMKQVAGHVEWLMAQHPDRSGEDLGNDLITHDPFWVRLVSEPGLLDVAQLFLGPDLALFASHYISKEPYSGKAVLWHQDGAYWPLEPMNVLTCWLAVDRATRENGCLKVIPGSHRLALASLRDNTDVDNVLGSESDLDVDESAAVYLELEPGDVEVHHPNILHASDPNKSPHRRCGLTIRYIPTSTRITTEEQPYRSAFHMRGAKGVNLYQPMPEDVPGTTYVGV